MLLALPSRLIRLGDSIRFLQRADPLRSRHQGRRLARLYGSARRYRQRNTGHAFHIRHISDDDEDAAVGVRGRADSWIRSMDLSHGQM